MVKQVQEKKEYFIQFTDEECEKLNIKENQKYSMEIIGDAIKMTPYTTIDIDISEFSRDTLERLIAESIEKDISVNTVIENALERMLEKYDK